ncbi:VOC family protein [Caulobacter sp. KR2-114]|uniref:VOC family protein n=1 Tax=Caulobacter sp. KR2-114 TaxID=3400912 RepID=UPI003C118172
MAATLRHFAIAASDLDRARNFWGGAFGWTFEPWGPPDFLQILGAGLGGALHGRHELAPGLAAPDIDLTFGVDDLAGTLAAITAAGGRTAATPFVIDGVGSGAWFVDPEGNLGKVMAYAAAHVAAPQPGKGAVRHFAINADDVGRARGFYQAAFDWIFTPWGPPGFYQVRNAGDGLLGALQGRREVEAGTAMPGYEVTVGVDDLGASLAAIEARGGRLLMKPFHIEGVGRLAFFADPEGVIAGAMQYDPGVWEAV